MLNFCVIRNFVTNKILELNENEVTIKTTFDQLMAINYEKVSTIDCPKVGENIFCKLNFNFARNLI